MLASITPADAVYCYHYDGVGSTVAVTDASQNVVNSYAYTPFGMILNESETFSQPFKYVGKLGVMSEDNGFYYMRARYYDPITGRFISEDPLGFSGGDVNLYVYGSNNPVLYSDPSGEFIFSGTAATYLFVVAPVAARYGPAIARAARSGYARVAPAVARAGRGVMNFARNHPRIVQGINDAIPSSLPSTSPAPTPGGAVGFAAGEAYRNLTQHQQTSGSTSHQHQMSPSPPSYTSSGGK